MLKALAAAMSIAAALAGNLPDYSCPQVVVGNGSVPPTDDSLWVLLDSVYVGSPPSSFWRGLRLDPNGVHAWMMGGDGSAIVQKRSLANGALVASFTTGTSSPYDLVRFGDSLCIAYYGSSQLIIYDTLGNYGRSISTPSGLRGVEWDGTKFWVTSVNSYRVYTISRGGVLLKTLNPTVSPSWMGVIALDRTYPNRFWISNGTSTINNVHYCSFDTFANTYTILATFSHPCNSYVGGLSFAGPEPGGSYLWLLVRSGQYLWRYRVHAPLDVHDVGCTKVLAPSGIVDSGVPLTPACSVYNYGTNVESYRVRLRIGAYSDTARATNHPVGTAVRVVFREWTPTQRGAFSVSCSTELAGDMSPGNDKATANGTVRVIDVAAAAITVPSGSYPAGSSITPAATWRNNGTSTASFQAWMCLDNPAGARVYVHKVDVSGLGPGAQIFVSSFPNHVLDVGGTWTVRCSTFCSGDLNRTNDTLDLRFTVGAPDIGVLPIVAPSGRLDTGTTVTPEGRVRNYGDVSLPFRAWFIIRNPSQTEVYREFIDLPGLSANRDTNLRFPQFNVGRTEGNWATRCSVYAAGDGNRSNDFRDGTFQVSSSPVWPYGWQEVEPMPAAPSGQACKDGAWLAKVGNIIYAAKGNKTGDFYSYNPLGDSDGVWTTLPSIPNGAEAKPPYKGAVGVGVGAGRYVYATKGNNTLGFWRYDIDSMVWRQMPDVPLGSSGKKVKGGTDMVYFLDRDRDTGYIYLLKGYKTDFFRFNIVTGTWDTALPEAPVGARAKWDKGSWLAYHRYAAGRTYLIYAHKAKYHELWQFDHASRAWASASLPGMPFVGMLGKSKKSKDGAAAAWDNGGIYALKGGNTQEFWYWNEDTLTWTELDTIPSVGSTGKRKRIKGGGDIIGYGHDAFFALKGNKTLELWRYVDSTAGALQAASRLPAMATGSRPAMAAGTEVCQPIVPAVIARGNLDLAVPQSAQRVQVRIFDASGRLRFCRDLSGVAGPASLEMNGLGTGIYLARVEIDGRGFVRKLVVR